MGVNPGKPNSEVPDSEEYEHKRRKLEVQGTCFDLDSE
jgi:hypothetical protein